MTAEQLRTLRDVVTDLGIEGTHLYSLGRSLSLTPVDPVVPCGIVARAKAESGCDARYRLVRDWLLAAYQQRRLGSAWMADD